MRFEFVKQLGSLRARTLAVVCLVVVIPVVFVWLSSPYEDVIGHQMRRSLQGAVAQATQLVRMDAPSREFESLARNYGVLIRVLDPDGETVAQANGLAPPGVRERLLFFPEPVPTIEDWDSQAGPTRARLSVRGLDSESKSKGRCFYSKSGGLLVCEYAQTVSMSGVAPRVVYATTGSSRRLTALYDERYSVLTLTILVLLFAVGLGLWLAWRIGRPLEELREQVVARTEPVVSTTPIKVSGTDEFAQLSSAFNRLLEALEEQNRANQVFLADMAHEVKNPVAAIRAAAQSLESHEVDEARAQRIARILNDSSRRLDSVVQNFLELARAEAGLPGSEREELELDVLLTNLCVTYQDDPRFAEIELEVESQPIRIHAAHESIETALRNLIENAASFAATRVDVTLERDDDMAVLVVRDDGPGIEPEDVERVFERFYSRRSDSSGTGLGLAMVRAIARAHRGQVQYVSRDGAGAIFRLELPVLRGTD